MTSTEVENRPNPPSGQGVDDPGQAPTDPEAVASSDFAHNWNCRAEHVDNTEHAEYDDGGEYDDGSRPDLYQEARESVRDEVGRLEGGEESKVIDGMLAAGYAVYTNQLGEEIFEWRLPVREALRQVRRQKHVRVVYRSRLRHYPPRAYSTNLCRRSTRERRTGVRRRTRSSSRAGPSRSDPSPEPPPDALVALPLGRAT